MVREKRLFYCCLRIGHGIKDCCSWTTCEVESCKSNAHHALLHVHSDATSENVSPLCNAVPVMVNGDCLRESNAGACLDILPVRVSNGKSEV